MTQHNVGARDPLVLGPDQQLSVEQAIRDTGETRDWTLHALNVRTNHVHTVISTGGKPELALNALKANATRHLRGALLR